jgi:class 3 adenylate cyclase
MEYTAVGMPVNLAARLCAAAGAGEVLVDAQAARQSDDPSLSSKGEMEIKGFSDVQQVYLVG